MVATIMVGVAGCAADEPACAEAAWVITPSGSSVAAWEPFETTADDLGLAVANPFDPAEIDVQAELQAPDGRLLTAAGFVYQDFTRRLVDGAEVLTPQGGRTWKVRFTPDVPGEWQWRWRVTTPASSRASCWERVTVTPPPSGRHGFVRVSERDRRYLRFDDGTPYFAVGENLAWYDARGTFAYDDWLAKLAAQGASYVRIWMPSWAFGLEAVEWDATGAVAASTLGDYGRRLDRAWQLDLVLEQARARGIAVMLCLQHHGEFSTTSNSEWDDSPYNDANGGPLVRPEDFFSDATARALFQRRLRYLVARWGHSPAIMAWELFNEVDLTDWRDRDGVAAWHAEMADYLKSIDPARHLVTTSVSGFLGRVVGMDEALFSLPAIDLTQFHLYGQEGVNVDFVSEMPALAQDLRRYNKPILAAEVGVDFRGPEETLARDPDSLGLLDSLWMGVFAGTAGTGMTWWWDSVVDPQDLYRRMGAVADFVSGVVFDEEALVAGVATTSAAGHDLATWALTGKNLTLVWIQDRDRLWYEAGDDLPVVGASLTLPGIDAGEWQARWLDPYAVRPPVETGVTASDGRLTVEVPTFTRDVAFRIERPR